MSLSHDRWTLNKGQWSHRTLLQAGLFVVVSTLTLTASFLGVVGLFTGDVTGWNLRLPFYVLVMALAFVGAIVTFEELFHEPDRILEVAVGVATVSFLLVTFGGEGVAYLVQNPQQVVASQLLFYILAAGLIAAGIVYWTLNHWSELELTGAHL
jgi:hypothetical protein